MLHDTYIRDGKDNTKDMYSEAIQSTILLPHAFAFLISKPVYGTVVLKLCALPPPAAGRLKDRIASHVRASC